MKPARFTRFPDLCSSRPIETGDHLTQRSVDVALGAPFEILVISWAILLRFYTEETAPTFKIYGRSVTVEVSDWAAPVVSDVTAVEGERFTGIVDEEVGYSADEWVRKLIILGTRAGWMRPSISSREETAWNMSCFLKADPIEPAVSYCPAIGLYRPATIVTARPDFFVAANR